MYPAEPLGVYIVSNWCRFSGKLVCPVSWFGQLCYIPTIWRTPGSKPRSFYQMLPVE